MPPMTDNNGKQYWRSLEELADSPEFREFVWNEFPAGALDQLDSTTDRRHFLKIMGASMALAGLGLAGCRRWPKEHIVPFAARPEGRDPGVTETYASTAEIAGVGVGLLVTSYDGRPIKIEGNPSHLLPGETDPKKLATATGTNVWTQASILDLYDPDRSRSVRHNGQASTWADYVAWASDHFASSRDRDGGQGVYVFSEATNSPSVLAMRDRMKATMPNATWLEYEAISMDNELAGLRMATGKPLRAVYDLKQATQTIVALDSDFLLMHPNAVSMTRDWAANRAASNKSMARLYAAESVLSLTGANADERIAIKSRDIAGLAGKLAAAVMGGGAFANHAAAGSGNAHLDAWLEHVVADLEHSHGKSLVIAGPRQPAAVHALAHMLNEALGNVGKSVKYVAAADRPTHDEAMRMLAQQLDAGAVKTLVMLGGNPCYTAPADLDFPAKLAKASAIVHLSDYLDETSIHANCNWHINRAHFLEAWGDARGYDGTYSVTQPLIQPMFNGKTSAEVLAVMLGESDTKTSYELTRDSFFALAGGADEKAWRKVVHDGVRKDWKWSNVAATSVLGANDLAARLSPMGGGKEMELVFTASSSVYDGRWANNGWLQELPDTITKLTWDNAALLGPATAQQLGVKFGDMIRLTRGSRSIDAAVMVLPGFADGSIAIELGYGRSNGGRVSDGAGVNAYAVRTSDALGFGDVTVTKTGGTYKLACTQDHHSVSTEGVGGKGVQDRLPTIFREASLDEYKQHPKFAKHGPHVAHRLNMWSTDLMKEGNYAWAMSIDLSACTGCSACVVACQAENNIPVVGKDQVMRGRELHWMRIDRYYRFAAQTDSHGHTTGYDPNTVAGIALQPVNCMHCENAPCEQVCPVAATSHDESGLNVMIYNRCIGTRYCSNNCPYKVRRFNYYDFHVRGPLREQPGMLLQVKPDYYTTPQADPGPLKEMQFNPDVTVRSRGVMEKCTYCIQRIERGKIHAKNAWVKKSQAEKDADRRVTVPDGSIVPACAQACPANAIVFGDKNDPNSKVSSMLAHERSYEMLEELNTRPRTRYLAKLRNPVNGSAASHAEVSGGHDAHSSGGEH